MKFNERREELNRRLMPGALGLLEDWLKGGKLVKDEYWVRCPFHDESQTSFSVNIESGKWKCLGCGKAGYDLVALYGDLNRIKLGEAYKRLANGDLLAYPERFIKTERKKDTNKQAERKFRIFAPAPDDAPLKDIRGSFTRADGSRDNTVPPNKKYYYTDKDGRVVLINCRWEVNSNYQELRKGKMLKPYFCIRYVIDGVDEEGNPVETLGAYDWRTGVIKEFDESVKSTYKVPLYGLQRLIDYPDLPVVVVSGEKCVDAVNEYFERNRPMAFIPVTWWGSATRIKGADFSVLKDRKVIWWPDNDDIDRNTMGNLAREYGGRLLHIEKDATLKGWDVADLIASGGNPVEFINNNKEPECFDKETPLPIERFLDKVNNKPLMTIENVERLIQCYGYKIEWHPMFLDFITLRFLLGGLRERHAMQRDVCIPARHLL